MKEYQCLMLYSMLLELIAITWIAYWTHNFNVFVVATASVGGAGLIVYVHRYILRH